MVKLTVSNLKELVVLAEKFGIALDGKNEAQLTAEVEAQIFSTPAPVVNQTPAPKPKKNVTQPVVQTQPEVKPDDTAPPEAVKRIIVAEDKINAQKIKEMLQLGYSKGQIAMWMGVKYQQVYQVEKRVQEENKAAI